MSSVLPRGLLRTKSLEVLWKETRSVALDLRESKTSEFWEDILHDVFIKHDDGYHVNSQQSPDEGGTKYCDFVVSNKTPAGRKVRLIVVDAKRLKVYEHKSQMRALEDQLADYCNEAIKSGSVADATFVYGLAVVGTRGRMFQYTLGGDFRPFRAEFADGAGENGDGYRDAEEDIWRDTFRDVKAVPPSGSLAKEL